MESPSKERTVHPGNFASVNGIEMYYEIYGEGAPFVLIHGGGSTIESNYGNILPFFSPYFQVIAVELQAHGRTGDRDLPSSFEQDADDVAGLLDILQIKKTNLLGFSNGANTCLQIAMRHPHRVDRMVVASAFYKRSGMFPGFWNMMETSSVENMPAPLKDAYIKVARDKSKLIVMHDKDRDRMLRFKDWNDNDLKSITAPVLVVSGDKDIISPEHTVEMHRLIPNSRLMILPGNHGGYLGEICSSETGNNQTEVTANLIRSFLLAAD